MSDPSIFLSYARSDAAAFATVLRRRIQVEAPGLTVWQDCHNMRSGEAWRNQISEILRRAEHMVVLVTPGAKASEEMRWEWRIARKLGVSLSPVKVFPTPLFPLASLPQWMFEPHVLDLDRDWDRFLAKLNRPSDAAKCPFMAPDLPQGFVARPAEFQQIVDHLLSSDHKDPGSIATTLRGAGGFGKTTLAAAVCHEERILEAFGDGILWVTLGQQPNLQDSVTKLIAALSRDSRVQFRDAEEAARHLRDVLEDRACLIVVDDVWDPVHLEPFLGGATRCARLITTRLLELALSGPRVTVDSMRESEARSLLVSGTSSDRSALPETLLSQLGNWPLLIRLANGAIRLRLAGGDTWEGATRHVIEVLRAKGVTAFDRRDATRRDHAVAATMQLSLAPLTTEEREQLQTLARIPEDQIIPVQVASLEWRTRDLETERILEQFDNLSLLEFDRRTGTVRFHDTVRQYLADLSGEPAQVFALPSLHVAPQPSQLAGLAIAARSLPCAVFGGDVYESVESRHGVTALVADVSGHGATAAMTAGMVRYHLRDSKEQDYEPKEVIQRIWKGLARLDSEDRFVTMICVRWDPRTKHMKYVNAGHSSGLILSPRGVQYLKTTGPVIHPAFPIDSWEQSSLEIGLEDQLLLYTDGVVESRSPSGDLFGEERLVEAARSDGLRGAALLDRILKSVQTFANERPQDDDITLLTMHAAIVG